MTQSLQDSETTVSSLLPQVYQKQNIFCSFSSLDFDFDRRQGFSSRGGFTSMRGRGRGQFNHGGMRGESP